jgi:hypothetical protein
MHSSPAIRKVFEGIATRAEMYRLFNRHRGDPAWPMGDTGIIFDGEWFEISEQDHNHMFEILPPLYIRADMFARREFLTGTITSIFFSLSIDGCQRFFHGYCDLENRGSTHGMKEAIIERESQPVPVMTREEKLEHIWSSTPDDYRGYAGDRWPLTSRGERTVLVLSNGFGTVLKPLRDLTDDEIAAKLPAQLRHPRQACAA